MARLPATPAGQAAYFEELRAVPAGHRLAND